MSSHLKGNRVDISLLESLPRNQLMTLLEKYIGPKAIVVEEPLDKLFALLTPYNDVLKPYEVIKIFPMKAPLPDYNQYTKHIIFITRPNLTAMNVIAQIVHATKRESHLVFVPRVSSLCIKELKTKGVLGSIRNIEEISCNLIPFDSDVVSMETPEIFREYNLENDVTSLYKVAQSISYLQSVYGRVSRVWGKGPAAKQVWDYVKRMEKENDGRDGDKSNQSSCIDQMLLIDRSVDLISPLATQLTYEGLIDEIFGINNKEAAIPAEIYENLESKEAIILDSADALFAELRDKNFNGVGALLSKQAKQISAQLEGRHDNSIQEMKVFVKNLQQLMRKKKLLGIHTAIAESIKSVTDTYEFLDSLQVEQEFLNCIDVDKANPYVEDMIAQKKPLVKVLQLVCLQCLTSSGLKPKLLEYYKREIVQVYGLEALLSIINLEKAGLLKVQSGSRQYTVLRKALRLTMEDTSEINPTDISYVHCIYAPLSVRLAEQLMKNGSWKQLQDVLGLLPGPTLDESPMVSTENPVSNDMPKVVLVFFIGGCTFAEISALRFLSRPEEANVEFLVATTSLINGKTFLQSLMDS